MEGRMEGRIEGRMEGMPQRSASKVGTASPVVRG